MMLKILGDNTVSSYEFQLKAKSQQPRNLKKILRPLYQKLLYIMRANLQSKEQKKIDDDA